jgi:photosystem II stability/assembly factor-like uncharacterized protein
MQVNSRAALAVLGIVLLLVGCAAPPAGGQSVPTNISEVPRLTPQQVKALLDEGEQLVLVDTRSRAAYDRDRIPGALSVPLAEIEARHGELPQDKKIVLYCT